MQNKNKIYMIQGTLTSKKVIYKNRYCLTGRK